MPALTVHNAEIKTAAVEVRTLTISGKQVTMAVFRQLQRGNWYELDQPSGPGWGTVNYHPDYRCKEVGQHLHVVWQLGTELRRALVEPPIDPGSEGSNAGVGGGRAGSGSAGGRHATHTRARTRCGTACACPCATSAASSTTSPATCAAPPTPTRAGGSSTGSRDWMRRNRAPHR